MTDPISLDSLLRRAVNINVMNIYVLRFFLSPFQNSIIPSLRFASQAKTIKTHATINEVLDDRAKMAKLKRELAEREKEKLELLRKVEELTNANQVNIILNVGRNKVEEVMTANQVNIIILNMGRTKVEIMTANQVNFINLNRTK